MSVRRIAALSVLAVSAGAVVAALPGAARSTIRNCATVEGSEVCGWVTMEGDRAVELGATIPISLIESAPLDAEMTWPPRALAKIELPEEARAAFGIDYLGINWEAHGHPPATFMTPHFDFHFYSVTREAVGAIDCSDLTKPAVAPEGYVLPDIDVPGMGTLVGLCVPLMGMHALPAGEVAAADPFGASMIIGYYGGKPIFFEPMVSRDLLLQRKDFSLPLPAVANLPAGVRYPRELHAKYDEGSAAYRLVATGFASR